MPKHDGLIKSVSRTDFFMEDFATSKFVKDINGFLTGKAVITNIGVFPYLIRDDQGNQSVRWEARFEEDVFSPEHKESLRMVPMTNDHPAERVTPENAKSLQVGTVGDSIIETYLHLAAPITITDSQSIQDVQDGKRALSEGYMVDIEMAEGTYLGVPYQAIQRNLRANHVAIVERGRAGDDAVMKLDSAIKTNFDKMVIDLRTVDLSKINSDTKINKEDKNMPDLKVIKIDSVERQAEAEVIIAYNKAEERADGLQTKVDGLETSGQELQAKLDASEAENKKMKEDAEKADKENPEKVDAAVTEKLGLIKTAEKHDVELKPEMSNMDIKKETIIKAFPDVAEKLDEVEDAYINASYDMAVKSLDKNVEDGAADENAAAASEVTDTKNAPKTADEKHADYVNSLVNASKPKEEK